MSRKIIVTLLLCVVNVSVLAVDSNQDSLGTLRALESRLESQRLQYEHLRKKCPVKWFAHLSEKTINEQEYFAYAAAKLPKLLELELNKSFFPNMEFRISVVINHWGKIEKIVLLEVDDDNISGKLRKIFSNMKAELNAPKNNGGCAKFGMILSLEYARGYGDFLIKE
ncbi:hypothetical protein ACJJI3_11480 [Microbulbifer sp. ZKSA004]|uniref:hypothetical protein n=1 Tax=unclassified Microbulbifer TaxID=2619833 RepID=UPI0039B48BD2